jgi:hypothetical protein
MIYSGSLSGISLVKSASDSGEAGELVVIPGYDDTLLTFLEDQFFNETQTVALPFIDVGGQHYSPHGQFVFFNDNGNLVHAIARVDGSAGIDEDVLVVTYAGSPWAIVAPGSAP